MTLAIGAVWLNKRYSLGDVVSALLAIVGLSLTMGIGTSRKDPHLPLDASSSAPMMLVIISLLADGVVANYQEQLLWQHGSSKSELACFSHGTALIMMTVAAACDKTTYEGVQAAYTNPTTLLLLCLLAFCGWASTSVALSVIKTWGTGRAAFILTVAKALAVAASLALLPRASVQASQIVGIVAVFGAVLLSCLVPHAPDTVAQCHKGGTAADDLTTTVTPSAFATLTAKRAAASSSEGSFVKPVSASSVHIPPARPVRLSLPASLRPQQPLAGGAGDDLGNAGASPSDTVTSDDGPQGAASVLRRRRLQSDWVSSAVASPRSSSLLASGDGDVRSSTGGAPVASPGIAPARLSVGSLQHLRKASFRTLNQLHSASQATLDALSAAGGIQRPAAIYDTLSPSAGRRPAVVVRALAPAVTHPSAPVSEASTQDSSLGASEKTTVASCTSTDDALSTRTAVDDAADKPGPAPAAASVGDAGQESSITAPEQL